MAGLSRRFLDAGYTLPKYMLPLAGATCFDFSVAGFLDAYRNHTFVFVMRNVHDTPTFVEERLKALGVTRYRLVVLDQPTGGQAETVERGLDAVPPEDGELTIFNIDTFRARIRAEAPLGGSDGSLEVFRGAGDGWSFVEPLEPGSFRVGRTTEKIPISDLCCTGRYSFTRTSDFRDALAAERQAFGSTPKETYVAPLYNHLIARGMAIHFDLIDREDVVFCGVPAEYELLRQHDDWLEGLKREVPHARMLA